MLGDVVDEHVVDTVHVTREERHRWPAPKPDAVFVDLPRVCAALKSLDWDKDEFLKRDMTDLARVWADRLAVESENRFFTAYFRWLDGDDSAANEVRRQAKETARRLKTLAHILELHTDFSVCDTYDRLNAVKKIAYPGFSSVLVDNIVNFYCTSHQAELATSCYIPAFEAYAADILAKIAKGERTALPDEEIIRGFRKRAIETPLEKIRSTMPRTRTNFNRALDELASCCP